MLSIYKCTINIFTEPIDNEIIILLAIGAPGEILVIHNITRYCDGLYECVASNGVGDAVSKEINIEVQCKYTVERHCFEAERNNEFTSNNYVCGLPELY